MLVWRGGMLLFCCCTFSACATFPHDTEQGIVEIRDVTAAVECELAAVAVDPAFSNRKLEKWKALVDLDLTLVQSAGADGKVTVTAPYGLAQVSVTPSLGVSGKDTSIAHVEFAPAISDAKTAYGPTCAGIDPSETRMGLANWLRAALIAVPADSLSGATFTKEFQIAFTAGARFGYTLLPTPNTVTADVGGSGTYDRTNRLTIAMTPPEPYSPPKPIPVYEVPAPSSGPQKKGIEEKATPAPTPAASARARATRDPILLYLLQRKAPVKISP